MATAPLRPRSTRAALTTAAALAAAATAHLAGAAPALSVPALSSPASPAGPWAPPPPAPHAPAPDPPAPACGTPTGSAFPLDTRIHGGPVDYPAGGSFQEWKLDLTNTTDAPCSGIHPVLVLADRARVLKPEQIRFEFYDELAARWRPVTFEATGEAENVGVFTGPDGPDGPDGSTDPGASADPGASTDPGASARSDGSDPLGGFGGFAVPAGRTLTVPVRLAFRAEAAPGDVVVNAAVVQRRGIDGDWVGESGDYRLTIGPARTAGPADPVPDTSGAANPSGSPAPASRPPGSPRDQEAPVTGDLGSELARTGRQSKEYALLLAPVAVALVLLGAVLVRAHRRPRHR
ncbi:hypothetical protein [Streptomyces zaomyceticus]|uniref:hypothetical protein n=1 Tax=Streptomyces zaomyceticus TaxID=68286 RepID=UPI002E10E676|nr:hypothetical protein OG237_16630 [Streptomyces zaomyceticus]